MYLRFASSVTSFGTADRFYRSAGVVWGSRRSYEAENCSAARLLQGTRLVARVRSLLMGFKLELHVWRSGHSWRLSIRIAIRSPKPKPKLCTNLRPRPVTRV